MTLSPADIEAIAAAVVRQMRTAEESRLDKEYLISLPIEDRQKILRARMREEDRQKKAKQSVK